MEYDDRLNELLNLQKGWDSYGAPPINPEVVAAVKSFLKAIRQTRASVVPTNSGGVQVESHIDGYDVEIEFITDGEYGEDEEILAFWSKRA